MTLGGLVKQYEVNPDLARMRDYKVTLSAAFLGDRARQFRTPAAATSSRAASNT